ncbi:hypothetical protein S40285_08742 [Stachybotrys chlorohalonatus IBT 40285]|uniref:FAD-binding domain-containing protein n=1 Tax=Stachybotrys chlorohalonatus (strain IBT 40285) TaxID=1283841 RepID=A0A084QUF6_STAC4|nr:hypothetical protein S40285_08742 [Stachybotrys chlorohalonata IBT 40285]
MSDIVVETEFLVVGAGPAGLKGMVISSSAGTADTPRAHVVNPFALECLRDLGVEDDCMRLGVKGKALESHRWCHSLVGEEYGKVLAWGSHPDGKRDMEIATPCVYLDLPQSLMEPILVKYATHHNFEVLFRTELVDVKRQEDGLLCTVRSVTTGLAYNIRAKYVFGADGGRSAVARAFPFKFDRQPSQGKATNLLVKMDLSHLLREREAQLNWIMNPNPKHKFGVSSCIRMVRPYNEWMILVMGAWSGEDPFAGVSINDPKVIAYIKELVGDDDIDVEILRLDSWVVRETVAEKFSDKTDVFLLGDAAHRHPPAYGLGSNTCIADAYNLAWKVAYVAKGLAGPALLESYTLERQPVGANLVKEANQGLRDHAKVWEVLGMYEEPEVGIKRINDLYAATPDGAERREELHKALELRRREGESVGIGMNQWYTSDAVYLGDETEPRPLLDGDPVTRPLITTYPGNRLPHAWLDISVRRAKISTHDLAGKGSFTLFTGRGGDAWSTAAQNISAQTGIPIKTWGIGFGLDYIDVHRQWRLVREVEENGCVLVRPDRYVAWRAQTIVPDCEGKLLEVLNKVLSREGLE